MLGQSTGPTVLFATLLRSSVADSASASNAPAPTAGRRDAAKEQSAERRSPHVRPSVPAIPMLPRSRASLREQGQGMEQRIWGPAITWGRRATPRHSRGLSGSVHVLQRRDDEVIRQPHAGRVVRAVATRVLRGYQSAYCRVSFRSDSLLPIHLRAELNWDRLGQRTRPNHRLGSCPVLAKMGRL